LNETERSRQDDDDRQATGGQSLRNRLETTETLSQEVRFNFDSDNLTANIGLYYFNQDSIQEINDLNGNDSRDVILGLVQPGLVPLLGAANASFAATSVANLYDDPFIISRDGADQQDIENFAVFANIEYNVSDFITVFAGARYDDESVVNERFEERDLVSELPELSDLQLPGGLAPFSALIASSTIPAINQVVLGLTDFDQLDNDADFSAFLPKAGVTLNWSDTLSTSFTVQRAYRAGGSGSSSVRNFTFDYVDWSDQQVNLIDPLDPSGFEIVIVNAASSSLKGGELELTYRAENGLDLFANAGYVETEFDDFPIEFGAEGALVSTFDLSGNEFVDAPSFI